MRIAVIGAGGVAGRAFVAAAQAAGHRLRAERADLFDAAALRRHLEGQDAVVNLASAIPTPHGRGDWALNDRIRRDGTAALLAAAADVGVGRIVQHGVAMLHNVDDRRPQHEDDPIRGDGVLASAADMEALVQASALDVRLLRNGLFYGPGTGLEERWLAEVRDPRFRIPGDGRAWLSPLHVADFAAAALCVLEHGAPHGVYIACDDRPLRLRELYTRAAQRQGVAVPPSGGPAGVLRSFRVSNARLRALGWRPRHAALHAP